MSRYGWCVILAGLCLVSFDGPPRAQSQQPALPAGALVELNLPPASRAVSSGLAFTADGKSVVLPHAGKLCLMDLATGKELSSCSGNPKWVASSADGRYIAGGNGAAVVWEPATENPPSVIAGTDNPNCTALSADGKLLATGHDEHIVRLFHVGQNKLVHEIKGHRAYITAVALSPDGKLAASGSIDQTLRLWDTATGKEIRQCEGQRDTVGALAFTPDGKHILAGSWDGRVRLCDVATGKEVRRFEGHTLPVGDVAISADGKTVATGCTDGTCRVWEAATGKQLRQIDVPGGDLFRVALSPDGKLVGANNGMARIWDVASGKEVRRIVQPADENPLVAAPRQAASSESVWSVVFSPDGKLTATGSADGSVRLCDAATGKEVRLLGKHPDAVWCVAFSPDGKTVASCGRRDAVVRLWDVASGKPAGSFTGGHLGGVSRIVYSRDGKSLVSAGGSFDPTIFLWDTANGQERQRFVGHTNYVDAVAISPDGKTIVSGSRDGSLRWWHTATGNEKQPLVPGSVSSVAFSPDGRLLAAGSDDGTVRLWDARTGKYRHGIEGPPRALASIAFSPDSRLLVSAGLNGGIGVTEIASSQQRTQYEQAQGTLHSLSFSPDGRRIASGSSEGYAFIWDLTGLGTKPAAPLDRGAVAAYWDSLADTEKAQNAIWHLTGAPDLAVAQIRRHVRPIPPTDAKAIAGLVAQLDAEDFEVREKASQELERLGELAVETLRKKLEQKPSLEMHRRIETLLERFDGPGLTGEILRSIRAVEVLELIHTPESRALLESLAKGADGSRLTQEARAALARLGKGQGTGER
jgi:WD40 repeat protein